MIRRIIALMTACLFMVSCGTSTHMVKPDAIKAKSDHISAVSLKSGEIIEFNSDGARLDPTRQEVVGITKDKKPMRIAYADIATATVQHTSGGGAIVVGAIVFFFLVILLATAHDSSSSSSGSSCPYVYSFDGERYVMDAEPLSGAVTKGLERDDLCRLENLQAVNGQYELLVRNELKETQYIDNIQLRVVEHPNGSTVCTDINGGLHVIANPLSPMSARSETGVDLRALLERSDHIPWQSEMPTDDTWRDVSLRNELTVSFPKPAEKQHANLVVDAATSQWGSVMMREMMQARGDHLSDWYASVDANGPAMADMVRFNQREELYFLKLYVREGDQWVQRGWIPGGAPTASELKVIPLDLSGVTGDSVSVRVQPPRGYWSFDFMAMSYDELPAPESTVIPLQNATTDDHADITSMLAAADGTYYEMKHIGDAAHMTFAAPAGRVSGERSVFLDARGYYHTQIDETQPEQTTLIADMLAHDGAIVRYSLQRFAEMAAHVKATP